MKYFVVRFLPSYSQLFCLFIAYSNLYLFSALEKNQQSLVFADVENRSRREETQKQEGLRRWLASSRWAAAAQFALAISLTSSQNDLQQLQIDDENSILRRTKEAVVTLQNVLKGKHNNEIEETLDHYEIPKDRWWSSLYKMVEGKFSQ